MFGTRHELDREIKNIRAQLPAKICLDLRGIMKSFACMILKSSYKFTMMLLIHMYAEIRILLCQGFSEKKISLLSDQMRHFWWLVLGSYYGEGKVGFFHCGQYHCNYVGHAPESWGNDGVLQTWDQTPPFHHIQFVGWLHLGDMTRSEERRVA